MSDDGLAMEVRFVVESGAAEVRSNIEEVQGEVLFVTEKPSDMTEVQVETRSTLGAVYITRGDR